MKHFIFIVIILTSINLISFAQQDKSEEELMAKLEQEIYKASFNGENEKVIRLYTKLIELDSTNGEYYYKRGLSFSLNKKNKNALGDYFKALKFEHDSIEVFLRISDYYKDIEKDCFKAEHYINQALKLEPKNGELYISKAFIKATCMHDTEGYLENLNIAISLESNRAKLLKETFFKRRKALREKGIIE